MKKIPKKTIKCKNDQLSDETKQTNKLHKACITLESLASYLIFGPCFQTRKGNDVKGNNHITNANILIKQVKISVPFSTFSFCPNSVRKHSKMERSAFILSILQIIPTNLSHSFSHTFFQKPVFLLAHNCRGTVESVSS